MCRRFYRSFHESEVFDVFGATNHDYPAMFSAKKCDVHPATFHPVLTQQNPAEAREFVPMRWGMIPSSAKSLSRYAGFTTINARAETLEARRTWSVPFHRKRCLVPVSGFYEWNGLDPYRKLYAVEMVNQMPFALAALWDCWKNPLDNKEILSYTIITTESNHLLNHISTRMPVIVEAPDFDRWLTVKRHLDWPFDLFRPFSAEKMSLVELIGE
ncbi:SOS response-associated peptidase [Granulicella sp. S190]|uniref:SOS response-associated peptidase n=1 Tax=Granulicella sp. S190 TaxID=1747226 RepID=UPI0020B10609|nr:SOS response-associated peptidase [Granulicella sp. S190]